MKQKKSQMLLAVALAFALFACQGMPLPPTPTPTLQPIPTIAPEAAVYLNEILDTLQTNSYYRNTVDWDVLRAMAARIAAGSTNKTQTNNALKMVLAKLGDRHAYLLTASDFQLRTQNQLKDDTIPLGKLLEDRIGYIQVPGFWGLAAADQTGYIDRLHEQIQQLDQQQPCGWVVDLSTNTGGNMWAMLAGLGPLLGDGELGAFLDAEGKKETWSYQDGKVLVDEKVVPISSNMPIELKNPLPPAAVITGKQTASAGEAVVVAFRGRPNTRSFGEPTAGFATAIQTFELKDGSQLGISVAVYVDRDGNLYGLQPIPPDETLSLAAEPGTPPQQAIDWLFAQPACKGLP
jgi:carboxyl-terminal processing protease